jgi:deoxyribose-phosphate aldolase
MDITNILSKVDHTVLGVDSTWDQIRELCEDAVRYQTASVCIPPSFVKRAKEFLGGRIKVCTVIGFPNGYATKETKVFETQDALKNGADEIDMVINVGALKEGDLKAVESEIKAVREACRGHILKVIIETCLLTQEEKIAMCRVVTQAGADFIKTSTGFSKGGATFEDVKLLKANIGPLVRVKASGGIATLEDAEEFIRLGSDRLGTSRIVKILKAQEAR